MKLGVTMAAGGSRRARRLRWHRRLGLSFAIVFGVVLATGLLLNHAEQFGLRSRVLGSDWLLRWYGMEPSEPPVAFRVSEKWVVGLGGSLFVSDRPVLEFERPVGVVAAGDLLVAAAAGEVALLTPQDELVERMTGASLPPGSIRRLGLVQNPEAVVLETDQGVFAFGEDFLTWRPLANSGAVAWSRPEALPAEVESRVLAAFRGEGLTLHRIILDVHTGRFFGRAGVWVVDLAALCLAFLALSGAWYALTRKGNGR